MIVSVNKAPVLTTFEQGKIPTEPNWNHASRRSEGNPREGVVGLSDLPHDPAGKRTFGFKMPAGSSADLSRRNAASSVALRLR
jgi:hypothetical protein